MITQFERMAETKDSNLTTLNLDECPKHETPAKKIYSFGQYQDVELTVFAGCKCSIVWVNTYFNDPAKHYNSYSQGAGAARMAVETANNW